MHEEATTGMPGAAESYAVGVVVFNPDPDGLVRLIKAVMGDAAPLMLFLNSPLPAAVERFISGRATCPIERLGDGTNVGLGVAYNTVMAAAQKRDIGRVLLLDQDSEPQPGMAGALAARMKALAATGSRPAVIGPRPVTPNGRDFARPSPQPATTPVSAADCIRLDFVISSGSLVDVAAFGWIGGFRSDFFIDFIDVEWCARAEALGFSCWMSLDTPMVHRLGDGVVRLPLVAVSLTRQPAARAYTFVRNQIALMTLGHCRPRQKLRTAARLLVHTALAPMVSETPVRSLRMMLLGWRHGLAGRLGPPPR